MTTTRWYWPHLVFGFLNLALTAPAIYLMLGLPLYMREHGWTGTEIGLFQLAGLPALFKVLLAMPVERFRPARRGYARWAQLGCGIYLLALLALAQFGEGAGKGGLFVLILLCALLASWIDIPVNALAMKVFPPSQRSRAGGIRSAALFLATITGGGAMLLLQQTMGWPAPFLAMGALLAASLPLLWSLDEPPDGTPGEPAGWWSGLAGYFRQPGAQVWSMLLLAYFPFVATAWIYLKPMLLDHGFASAQVAWISGIGGGVLGAVSSLAAAWWGRRVSLPRALPLCALVNVLVLATLTGVIWLAAGPLWLVAVSGLLAFALGATSALTFGLMMAFARTHSLAADYGVQASLFTLGRMIVPPLAGMLLDRYDYHGMLLALTLAALAVALLARVLCGRIGTGPAVTTAA